MTARDEKLRDDLALPEDLRLAFAAYAEHEPEGVEREAMFAELERALRAPGPRRTSSLRWYLGGLALLVAIGFSAWLRAPRVHEPAPAREEAPPAPAPRPAPSEVQAQEEPPPVAPPPAKARPRRVREPAPSPRADPASELALLTRAKRLLASDASQALALTEQHAQLYPFGSFAEEREVIAIEALMRAGEQAAAQARAASFRAHHPKSTHLDRVRVILQER